jgi:hypothetical protein
MDDFHEVPAVKFIHGVEVFTIRYQHQIIPGYGY